MTVLEMLRPLTALISIDHLVGLMGIGVFAAWLMRTSLGRKALVRSRPRRNSMAPYVPFIPFFFWFFGILVIQSVVDTYIRPVQGELKVFQDQITFGFGAVLAMILILVLVKVHFARGLKGFGLRPRTIPRDLGAAFINLLAVWPLVAATMIVTTVVGEVISRLFRGRSFEMPQHEALKEMSQSSSLSLFVLLVVLAVVIAPLIEEMLFRGLLQTLVRTHLESPWVAIVVTSVLFALVHGNPEHWPALFILSMGLGYAYEASGSLFRPIFMHALFNGAIIVSTMTAS